MRLLKLFAVLATVTAAAAAAAHADPGRHLQAVLRPAEGGPANGFGLVKFRQPKDTEKIVYLDLWVRDLLPNHSYRLQRAVDTTVDDNCPDTEMTMWLTLGKGLVPEAVATDDRGSGRAELFRDLATVPTGRELDIHFRVVDAVTGAVVLQSACYQFTVRP
jgi:hypothetical protein